MRRDLSSKNSATFLPIDVQIVSRVALCRRRKDWFRQLRCQLQARRQFLSANALEFLILLPARAGEITAHHAFHRQRFRLAHQHRTVCQLRAKCLQFFRKPVEIHRDEMTINLIETLKPKRRKLIQNRALARNRIGENDVVIADYEPGCAECRIAELPPDYARRGAPVPQVLGGVNHLHSPRIRGNDPLQVFTASSFGSLATSSLTFSSPAVQTTASSNAATPEGTESDPIANSTFCTLAAHTDANQAVYTFAVPSASAIVGGAVVHVIATVTGSSAELAARLWDVTASNQSLISRTAYRIEVASGTHTVQLAFELWPDGWPLLCGHQLPRYAGTIPLGVRGHLHTQSGLGTRRRRS